MKSLNQPVFPCDECEANQGERSSCLGACAALHKFLREDLRCHTRVRTTELILEDAALRHISDQQQFRQTRLTLNDLVEASPGYWDIELAKNLEDGEKEVVAAFYVEGLSYKEIASKYRISIHKVKYMLMRLKKRLRKVRSIELLAHQGKD